MNETDMTFVLHTPEGDTTMQVLFTFTSPETGANYMLYTPDAPDSEGPISVAACRYDPDDLTRIFPLEGKRDRQIVQGFINYVSTHTPEEAEKIAPSK